WEQSNTIRGRWESRSGSSSCMKVRTSPALSCSGNCMTTMGPLVSIFHPFVSASFFYFRLHCKLQDFSVTPGLLMRTFFCSCKLNGRKSKNDGGLPILLFARNPVLPDHTGICDLQSHVTFEVQHRVAVHDRVREIKANPHIAIGENRTIFYHGSVIHLAVAFHAAASSNQALGRDPRAPTDVGRRHHPCVPVHLGAVVHPHAQSCFGTLGAKTATGTKAITSQPA